MSNLKLAHKPQTLAEAEEILDGRDSLRIGHNTRLERVGGDVFATYHGNRIVWYSEHGTYASYAGWATITTANRLNMLTPGRFNIKDREPQINGKTLDNWTAWYTVG